MLTVDQVVIQVNLKPSSVTAGHGLVDENFGLEGLITTIQIIAKLDGACTNRPCGYD